MQKQKRLDDNIYTHLSKQLICIYIYSTLTIIQCYSPTNDAEPEEKEALYSMLQAEMERVPAHGVLIIMGDFSAKVGSDNVGTGEICFVI